MKKKICIISTSRADYSFIKPIVITFRKEKKFKTIFLVTGTHLEKKFGYSVTEIVKDKLKIDKKISINLNKKSSSENISFLSSEYIKQFSKFLKKINPDYLILLGDRYEVLSAALSAYILNIPIAHIAGGEVTKGSYDDGFRHSITKLSNIHFVTTNEHRKRVIQLGENPKTVFNVGSVGLITLKNNKYLIKNEIEKKLKTKLFKKNVILTFHPETLGAMKNKKIINCIFNVLNSYKDLKVFVTSPNLDKGRDEILEEIIKNNKKFPKKNIYIPTLGSQMYYSLAKISDGVIGNSSSGISEIPSLNIGSLNIGSRQSGRPMAKSIINLITINNKNLKKKINQLFSKNFKKNVKSSTNPFYKKDTDKKILNHMKKILFSKKTVNKEFYDM